MTAPLRIDPLAGRVRALRAAALTVPTVGAATAAHSLADGCAGPLAITVAAGLCWPAAVVALGARRRLPALLAFVVLAQLLTHLLLERMCTDVMAGRTSLVEHLLHTASPTMVATHVVSALVTAVLLHRADAALFAAHALRRAVGRLLLPRALPVLPVARRVVPPALVVLPPSAERAAPLQGRGPPAPCAPVLAA